MTKHIDTRTEAEKALPADESATIGLTIYPEGEAVLQTVALNVPGEKVTILLDLGFDDEGSPRYGLKTGFPFNEADGLDGLVAVFEAYLVLLRNPTVRAAFVEERIQPTAPTLFDDDEAAPEPSA